jgi:hypothetical protein
MLESIEHPTLISSHSPPNELVRSAIAFVLASIALVSPSIRSE